MRARGAGPAAAVLDLKLCVLGLWLGCVLGVWLRQRERGTRGREFGRVRERGCRSVHRLVGERVSLAIEGAPHVLKGDLAALRLQRLDQRARLVGQG